MTGKSGIKSSAQQNQKTPEIQQAKWPGILDGQVSTKRPGVLKDHTMHGRTNLLTVRQ